MNYAYNAGGQRTSLTYPGGNGGQQGEAVSYGYDALGQLTSVTGSSVSYLASATYNVQGQMTQLVNDTGSNGLTRRRVYDASTLRLTAIKAGTAAPFDNLKCKPNPEASQNIHPDPPNGALRPRPNPRSTPPPRGNP